MPLAEDLEKLFVKHERERFNRAHQRMLEILDFAAPQRTGELRRSLERTNIVTRGNTFSVTFVVHAPQGRYTDEGTGIFGPRGQRIYPRVAAFLAWTDQGRFIRAKSIAGAGQHKLWFTNTVQRWPEILSRS